MKCFLPMLLMFTTAYAQTDLPAIGAEIKMTMLAEKTPLQFETKLVYVDFRGGIKHGVEANPVNLNNSRLFRVLGFTMTAELPADEG
ncbi:hypothetical protein BGZ98_006077, partial [Dissophora globulifera]